MRVGETNDDDGEERGEGVFTGEMHGGDDREKIARRERGGREKVERSGGERVGEWR